MTKLYIPEIDYSTIDKKLNKIKNKFQHKIYTDKLILTQNGIIKNSMNDPYILSVKDVNQRVITNYINDYSLIIINEVWDRTKNISQIPLNNIEVNIEKHQYNIGQSTNLKFIIEKKITEITDIKHKNKTNTEKNVVDMYFIIDKEIDDLLKNDMGYFLKMLM